MSLFLDGKLVSALPMHAIIDVAARWLEVLIRFPATTGSGPGLPIRILRTWRFAKMRMCFTGS